MDEQPPTAPNSPDASIDARQKKKWREFEELAASIQRQFVGQNAKVTTNERIRGRRTGTLREIDIAIRERVGQFEMLVVIDCKDYRVPVNVKDVETFMGLVEDVGANKGVIVAARGFTASAKTRASDARIDVLTLIDAGSKKWPMIAAIPVLIADSRIKTVQFTISSVDGPLAIRTDLDPRRLVLYGTDGTKLGMVGNILIRRWHEGAIPRATGSYEGIPLTTEPTWLETDGVRYRVNVVANVEVEVVFYFKMLPLEETQGFKDEITGSYTTRHMKTSVIDTRTVEAEWERLSEDEARTRSLVMRLDVSSILEELKEDESPETPRRPTDV